MITVTLTDEEATEVLRGLAKQRWSWDHVGAGRGDRWNANTEAAAKLYNAGATGPDPGWRLAAPVDPDPFEVGDLVEFSVWRVGGLVWVPATVVELTDDPDRVFVEWQSAGDPVETRRGPARRERLRRRS